TKLFKVQPYPKPQTVKTGLKESE
ncbi:TPA: DNA modification methyltransferase, partial [Escherichia coli]|nr:DNA modification methyltransferase [Escherichia coli]EGE7469632.1 DNA modification methyltransferase [Escherichia coli]EIC1354246.1 DNA modification methyltransferase [Escherichia coli]EJL4065774.1 DNA modification methyltransferase [Escherichia coli]